MKKKLFVKKCLKITNLRIIAYHATYFYTDTIYRVETYDYLTASLV